MRFTRRRGLPNNRNVADGNADDNTAARRFAWLKQQLQSDDRHQLLPTSFFNYITKSVLISFLGVIGLILVGHQTLYNAFITNVPLNGLIVTIMITGVTMSVLTNIRLWRTGLYLLYLETVALAFNSSEDEYKNVQLGLKRQAAILDCKNMQNLLDNLKTKGALNVNDNDARMIKSKLGARLGRARNKVSFLSGLLVMLGLLGTFLGLLGTIDAVGEAMAGMANIGQDTGAGDGGMAGFISSLSAPLQGMGLAFSSSLFGLSGSLLVGTFQFFTSGAQDTFIESFSRWLDEQIPDIRQANKAAGFKQDGPPVADAELKAWIVGFIQHSRNTQRELAGMVDAILVTADASKRSIETSNRVLEQQQSLAQSLSTLNTGVVAMVDYQKRLDSVLNTEFSVSILQSQKQIGSQLRALDTQLHGFASTQSAVVGSLDHLSKTLKIEIPKQVVQSSNRLSKAITRMNNKIARLGIQEEAYGREMSEQMKRLEELVETSEKRTVQRDRRVQAELQNRFQRESDKLKKSIGAGISASVNKDVIPFIASEQRELKKIVRLIDKQYGRRKDDKQDPDVDAA